MNRPNAYKDFRTVEVPTKLTTARLGRGEYALSPRFDQPTYLSFKLRFGARDHIEFNNAGNRFFTINYDIMPHPLFGDEEEVRVDERSRYSSINYLLDANEFTRASMLKEFIQQWDKLQTDFPWYFQSIEGVNDLLKVDPKKGMRITSDKRLTLTVLEGVDLRMTHLLNLYRKIAWDDTYQRWVLPDMMRYFTLDIYLTEFRTFHTPNNLSGYGYYTTDQRDSGDELYLNILDNVLPVWKISCEMCEFDLENITFNHLDGLNIGETPAEGAVTFGIKVGKVYEEQIYPTFYNAYMIDKALNGLDRAKESEVTIAGGVDEFGIETPTESEPFDSTNPQLNNNTQKYNNQYNLMIGQSQPYSTNAQDKTHISGAAYNQMTNSKSMFGAGAAGNDGLLFTADDNIASVDPTLPNTWFGNAVNWGKSFGLNTLEKFIDKAKITPIPGLGVSFNEAKAALESKNFITALGLIRKGVDQVAREYVQPSELLEGDITDALFREYLEGVSKSEATNETEVSLVQAANIALNDDGTWEQIKDFSKATDLTGPGELNLANPIQEGTTYRDAVNESIGGDLSHATDLTAEGQQNVPTNLEGGQIFFIDPGQATQNNIIGETLETSQSNINKNIEDGFNPEAPDSAATNSNESLQTGPEGGESTINDPIGDGYDGGAGESTATQGKPEGGALPNPTGGADGNIEDGYDQGEDGIGRTISPATIFEGVPSSQATTNKIQ